MDDEDVSTTVQILTIIIGGVLAIYLLTIGFPMIRRMGIPMEFFVGHLLTLGGTFGCVVLIQRFVFPKVAFYTPGRVTLEQVHHLSVWKVLALLITLGMVAVSVVVHILLFFVPIFGTGIYYSVAPSGGLLLLVTACSVALLLAIKQPLEYVCLFVDPRQGTFHPYRIDASSWQVVEAIPLVWKQRGVVVVGDPEWNGHGLEVEFQIGVMLDTEAPTAQWEEQMFQEIAEDTVLRIGEYIDFSSISTLEQLQEILEECSGRSSWKDLSYHWKVVGKGQIQELIPA